MNRRFVLVTALVAAVLLAGCGCPGTCADGTATETEPGMVETTETGMTETRG